MLSTSKSRLAAAVVTLAFGSALAEDSQLWHERYHGILSMAAYGDYATLCPQQAFTHAALQKAFPGSTAEPWTLLQVWGPTASGSEGFIATIPEMDKVVMVFKGMYGWEYQTNMTSIPINDILYLDCPDCKAHSGAVTAYLEAREATNDWAIVKQAVNETGHQWSITGHGFGGMVAQVASLDLGWRGLAHWSHNHGTPRTLNQASAALFEKLYAGEAGQRCVANNDSQPNVIPESDDYTHVLQGFHIWGRNQTFGVNWAVCNSHGDPECEGGDVESDTWFYYTQVGSCGAEMTYSQKVQKAEEASMSSEYFLTATVDPNAISTTTVLSTSTMTPSASSNSITATSSTSSSSSSASTVTTSDGSAGALVANAAASSDPAAAASTDATGAASRNVFSSIGSLLALACTAFVAIVA